MSIHVTKVEDRVQCTGISIGTDGRLFTLQIPHAAVEDRYFEYLFGVQPVMHLPLSTPEKGLSANCVIYDALVLKECTAQHFAVNHRATRLFGSLETPIRGPLLLMKPKEYELITEAPGGARILRVDAYGDCGLPDVTLIEGVLGWKWTHKLPFEEVNVEATKVRIVERMLSMGSEPLYMEYNRHEDVLHFLHEDQGIVEFDKRGYVKGASPVSEKVSPLGCTAHRR